MTLDEVERVIENETIEMEFKSTTGELTGTCRTLCAFLNDQGGFVFIGINRLRRQ